MVCTVQLYTLLRTGVHSKERTDVQSTVVQNTDMHRMIMLRTVGRVHMSIV